MTALMETVFVLLIGTGNYINTYLKFPTLDQCKEAMAIIEKVNDSRVSGNYRMTCIPQGVKAEKPKKMKCKITNNFNHRNNTSCGYGSCVMNGYPYPEAIECTEE